MTKHPLLSKTIIFNLGSAAWAIYQYASENPATPEIVLALSLINIGLRFITKGPVKWGEASGLYRTRELHYEEKE